jgi:hypothetical protein
MSKADYFRRFAIWNRPLPDTDHAGPMTVAVADQIVDVAPAQIESVASVAVIDRQSPAPPVIKVARRKQAAPAGDVVALPQARLPVPPTTNYLTTAEAADLCRLSVRTLERYRVSGGGPLFTKCGPGKRARVVYRRSDLEAWLAGNTVSSTANWSFKSRKPT